MQMRIGFQIRYSEMLAAAQKKLQEARQELQDFEAIYEEELDATGEREALSKIVDQTIAVELMLSRKYIDLG